MGGAPHLFSEHFTHPTGSKKTFTWALTLSRTPPTACPSLRCTTSPGPGIKWVNQGCSLRPHRLGENHVRCADITEGSWLRPVESWKTLHPLSHSFPVFRVDSWRKSFMPWGQSWQMKERSPVPSLWALGSSASSQGKRAILLRTKIIIGVHWVQGSLMRLPEIRFLAGRQAFSGFSSCPFVQKCGQSIPRSLLNSGVKR